jgi:hypothetical protein
LHQFELFLESKLEFIRCICNKVRPFPAEWHLSQWIEESACRPYVVWCIAIYICFSNTWGLFESPYLSLSTGTDTCDNVWENLWKHLMTCS